MADEKISAMPSGTNVNNLDVLPMVIAGANVKVTKTAFLTGALGFDIFLTASLGQAAVLSDAMSVNQVVANAAGVAMSGMQAVFAGGPGGTSNFHIDTFGQQEFIVLAGQHWKVSGTLGTSFMEFFPQTGVFNLSTAFNPTITYISFAPGNWAGPPPADIVAAITRIAAKVAGALGPIP